MLGSVGPLSAGTALLAAALAAPVTGQVTERVSVDSGGAEGNNKSWMPSISADGRYVAFQSSASNLVSGDTNGTWDVFVHDRLSGTTERMSVDSSGVEGNADSYSPSISADGGYVAFYSYATNLASGDTNGLRDVFVRDRLRGTTERVSVNSAGAQGNGASDTPSISADGRYVAFQSSATNLVSGDTYALQDVFVRDRVSGTTERVSVDSAGAQGSGDSSLPSISADGRYVAFDSVAFNLVSGDTNGRGDVFVRDRSSGTTERVSVDSLGAQGNFTSGYGGGGYWYRSEISADGRYVAFLSEATNLVSGDTNAAWDVFVHDRQSGTTERVSIGSGGAQGNQHSLVASISADGRYVAFESAASNLVSGDTNGAEDVFVRDRQSGTTERVSVDSAGVQVNGGGSYLPSISADGRYVSFHSEATNLVSGDTNGFADVFVRDRFDGRVLFDFETEDDFTTPLANSQHVDGEFGRLVRISAAGANLGAATFDTTPGGPNDPALDADLLFGHGNVLVLQDSAHPAQTVPGFFDTVTDDADGGDLVFDFLAPLEPQSVLLADLDPPPNQGASVTLLDGSGKTRIYWVEPGWTGGYGNPGPFALDLTTTAPQPGNGTPRFATASEDPGFEQTDVVRMVVHFTGFGALDDLSVRIPTLVAASATVRDGSGRNPTILRASSRPVLGTTWRATLDTSWSRGGVALLDVRGLASAGSFTPFGERLVEGALVRRASRAYSTTLATFACPIPFDPSLSGRKIYVQALCVEASPSPGAKVRTGRRLLTNALDLVLGF